LNIVGQTVIATWAVKTAMVLEGMDPTEKHAYSQLQRERLRLRETIPWRTSVWLAASAEPDWFMSTKNRHLGEEPAGISGVSITMGFAHAVLQVLTIRVPEVVGPDTQVTTGVRQGPWSQLTVRVWPPTAAAHWPPAMGLSGEAGLDALAERFRTTDASVSEIEPLTV
jgi:hypothetical protein